MALQASDIAETESRDDLGYFFRRLGEICFNAAADQDYNGPASSLAVAASCGAVFFSDCRGVYIARTQDVVAALQKWSGDGQMPPSDSAAVCRTVLDGPAALLSLSPDDSLLGVCSGAAVRIYPTQQLVEGRDAAPLASFQLGSNVKQLCWRPSEGGTLSFLALTSDGALLAGRTSSPAAPAPLAAAPSGAACAAWDRGGSRLAVGRGDEVVVCDAEGGELFSILVTSQEVQDDGQRIQVDSLLWLTDSAILVNSTLLEGDEEMDIAPQCVLTWEGGSPAAIQLAEFFAPNTAPYAADGPGPWLLAATVPPWGAVVYCHRKSNDDHIKVAAMVEGQPVAADITDDRLAIRIPNAPGDEDNYVVGLGLDFTSTGVKVEHPTDPNAADLPPQPVLLVATSDGVLRAYTFGNMNSPTTIVAPPRPLPPPPMAAPAAAGSRAAPAAGAPADTAAAAAAAALDSKAAATALPSEEEAEEWEEVPAPGAAAAAAKAAGVGGQEDKTARAAAVALPSDDDEEGESEAEEEGKAAAAPTPTKPLFAFATSAAPAPASSAPVLNAGAFSGFDVASSAPAFGFAPPASAAPRSAPSFGFSASGSEAPAFSLDGTSPAPAFSLAGATGAALKFSFGGATGAAPGFGFDSAAAPSPPAAISAPLFGAPAAALAAAPALGFTMAAGSSGGQAAAPTIGFAPQATASPGAPALPAKADATVDRPLQAPAQQASAKVPASAEERKKEAAPESAAVEEKKAPAKSPLKTREVEVPAPKLKGEAPEAAALEADFLASLHHTRKLEAELHDILKAAVSHDEDTGSYKGFKGLRAATLVLHKEVVGLASRLAEQKARFVQLSAEVKDAHRKCEALPSFHPAPPGGDASRARELLLRQPLEPPLANLRASIQAQLRALRLKSDELQECLMVLEERQRQYRSGDTVPTKLTSQQLYNAVNSQMAVVAAQAAKLEALARHMRERGLLGEQELAAEDEESEEAAGASLAGQLEALGLKGSPLTARLKAVDSSSAKKRSPWRLVKESPLSARRQSLSPLSAGTPTQAAGPSLSLSAGRRSALVPVAPAGTGAVRWGQAGTQSMARQILSRVQSEEGDLRVTAAKRRPPPLALPPPAPSSAAPATAAAAESPPPSPLPLPAFSLSAPAVRALPAVAEKPAKATATAATAFGSAHVDAAGKAPAAAGSLFGGAGAFAGFGGAASSATPFPAFGAAAAEPAPAFQGAKPGYELKLDGSGLGYYKGVALPTAGSIFGKASTKPSTPSFAAPVAPAAAALPSKGPTVAKQPPIPSMVQVKAAADQMKKVLGSAPGGGKKGGEKEGGEQKPAEAAIPPAVEKAKQPPVPSMAQFAQAQQLMSQLAPSGQQQQAPAAAVAAAPPAAKPPAKPSSSQPPIPSLAAAKAAQQRFESFLGGGKAEEMAPAAGTAAPAAPAAASAASAAAPAAAVRGEGEKGKEGEKKEAEGAAAPASAAPAAAEGALSFGSLGLGATGGESGASPFGKGLTFGAAASAPGLFGSASAAPSSSPFATPSTAGASSGSPFGAAAAPASAGGLFGAAAAPASTGGLFGAASAPAASAGGLFGSTAASGGPPFGTAAFGAPAAPGTTSPFGAITSSSAATSPFGAPASSAAASASPFGAPASSAAASASPFGAPASSAAASASPFGAPASSAAAAGAASPFGGPVSSAAAASSPFGLAASSAAASTPSFGLFGQAASASTPSPFGGAGFGQVASPASPLGQTSVFGQAAAASPSPGFSTPATPGFGQPSALGSGFGTLATPGFGQPSALGSGFGQPAALGVGVPGGGGSVFGSTAGGAGFAFGQQAQPGGSVFVGFAQQAQQQGGPGFGTFGQQAQQQGAGGFGAFGQQAQQGVGFGVFGGASPAAAAPKPGGNPAMWAMRK